MPELIFLQDLAIVMTVSAVIMIFCQRFHLPVVLGYILAGMVIGPHTPPFPLVTDFHSIHTLSELGVIFLLFSIGLEFSLTKLAKVGLVAFIAATLEILLMIWFGFSLGRMFGWNFIDSLFLGALLSISSTTIIAKILIETKKLQEKFARVILGILIVEDLLAIVIIAVLSGLALSGSFEASEVVTAMLKVFSFVLGILFVGFLLVPRLLRYLTRFESSELIIVTVLGLCFGVSLAAAKAGFSVALGAFLIGAIIAETKQVREVIHKMEPIRDMFTAIFFVSVGMFINPQIISQFWVPILMITLITIFGKVFSCSFATFLTGYQGDTALKVGLGLAQIGEFSFIIAQLGETTQVTSSFLYPIAVSVSGITTVTTPFLMRNTSFIIEFLSRLTPKPFRTLLNLYTSWLQKLGGVRSERSDLIWRGLGFYLPRLFFYAIAALVLFYGMSVAQSKFQFFPGNFYWIAVGVCVFPFFIGFAYTLDQILWNALFLNLIGSREEVLHVREVNQTMHNTFRFFLVFLAGLAFIAAGSAFLPRLPLMLSIIGLVFISGFYLWASAKKLHEKLEKTALGIFDIGKPTLEFESTEAYEELTKLIREEYPWEVTTEDFLLPYRESAANQTLKDLRLRSETGASVVAIYRGTDSIINPSAETLLLPGDVLLLMGDSEQVKRAVSYLNQKIKETPQSVTKKEGVPKTHAFTVQTDCLWLGKSLSEIKLKRRTGATVLGIRKGNVSINNPHPDTILEEEDILILFGWPGELELAIQHLGKRIE